MPSVTLLPDAVGGILHITDHLARAKASVIEQYRDKTKFNGLLTPFVNQIQKLEDAFWDLIFRGDLSLANLLSTGRFDVDTDADGLADGWQTYNFGLENPITSSIVPGRSGKAQRVTWAVGNTSSHGIASLGGSVFGVYGGWLPNSTYLVYFYARALSGTAVGSGLQLNWNNFPTTQISVLNPPLTGDWQLYVFQLNWGASVEVNPVGGLFISISGNVFGVLEFDDAAVVLGSSLRSVDTLGASFNLLGRILGEPRNGRVDESYRRFLLAKIIANRSSGTTEDLYSIFRTILGSGYVFKILDFYPKFFIASVGNGAIADSAAVDLVAMIKKTKDAGAGNSFEYGNTAPLFGFDGNGSGFDTGYFGGTI